MEMLDDIGLDTYLLNARSFEEFGEEAIMGTRLLHTLLRDPTGEARWTPLKTAIQHVLNPLHLYCRLVDLRIPRTVGLKLVHRYEFLWKRVVRI